MEAETLVKCATTISLAAGAVGCVVGAVAVTGIAAKVSLAALAAFSLAATWGSMTAAINSHTLEEYAKKLPIHTAIALNILSASISTLLFQAIINAFAQALGDTVYTGLTGRKTTRFSFA